MLTANDDKDQTFLWVNNVYPKEIKEVNKIYYDVKTSDGYSTNFKRQVFLIQDLPKLKLIHYFGDPSVFQPLPHGNDKKENAAPYHPTKPSTLSALKQQLEQRDPHQVYKANIHINPRNTKQCQNLKYNIRKNKFLPLDQIGYVHLLNEEYRCVQSLLTIPDLGIIIVDQKLLQNVNDLMMLDDNEITFMFQYDTTFNICDYYVSPLKMRLHMFESNPGIPIAFLLHEYKTEETHEFFFREISKRMPYLSKKGFWVTDRELSIRNAIKKVIQPKHLLRCWNHTASNITEWVSRHNGKRLDQSFYLEQVKQILKCETRIASDELFEKL